MSKEKYDLKKIIEKTDDSLVVEFTVPKDSPYFDGHFPQVSILPAVAQVELVSFVYKEHFNKNISIAEIKRAKFTNLVMPLFPLVMQLKKTENSVAFKIHSLDEETVFSSGTLLTKE